VIRYVPAGHRIELARQEKVVDLRRQVDVMFAHEQPARHPAHDAVAELKRVQRGRRLRERQHQGLASVRVGARRGVHGPCVVDQQRHRRRIGRLTAVGPPVIDRDRTGAVRAQRTRRPPAAVQCATIGLVDTSKPLPVEVRP
jgi:hypothetical protein